MMPSIKGLISVIIPVYNVENYLDRCLESVIKQNYSNLEIILVDDGSTDGSAMICDNWADRYPSKIRVIHQENQGASIARKNGIANANGAYLTFVDSDDYVMPQYISALYEAATENDTLVAVCPFLKIKEGETCTPYDKALELRSVLDQDALFQRFFKYEFWGLGGGCYSKSLFNSIIYPQETINEDYFIKAQIFSKVNSIGYCPQPLYIYETHSGSLSNQRLSLRALGEFDNALATWRFISEHKPMYRKQALAIVSEAACKWLREINRSKKTWISDFSEYKTKIIDFISQNFIQITSNPYMLWKIRLVLISEYIKSRIV